MGISKFIDYMGNIAFDYSDLQMTLRSLTCSDGRTPNPLKVEMVLQCTYENSKSCEEIFDIIHERLNSKRSTHLNLLKTLGILETLLLKGSEQFISIATNDKDLIRNLTIHHNSEVKQKANDILKLETDRTYLFECRKDTSKKSADFNSEQEIKNISSSENLIV